MTTLLLCAASVIAAAPYAHTQPATSITSASAALNGTAVANGLPSLAWFEWGDRGSYGQTTSPADVGSGSTVVQVRAAIDGLTNRAQYQCRLVVSNSSGIAYGKMVLFTTGAKVMAWGLGGGYNYGQANIPAGLTDVVSLSTGREYSFAILTNGAIVGWGRNDDGQASIPAGLTNVVAIAGSSYTSAAIRSDGSVFAWGDSRTNVPSALTNAIAVAGGLAHLLGLRGDGKVFAWGYNSQGQANVPSSLNNVVAIAGGDYFSAALNANGTVTTWGNLAGSIPSVATNVVGIAAGAAHCLALRADGKVVAWGNNSDSQTTVPLGLSNVVAISAGYSQSLALKADGSIVTWGSGNGTNAPKVASKIVAIVSGAYHNAELGNRAPQADAKKFSGPANHDLVVVLSGSDLNSDSLSWRLASLPATGSLYQFDGGIRGALVSVPGTAVSDPLGRLIFAPATDGYGDPFASFNYVANDGELDSEPATITIQIIATPYAATQPPAGFTSNSLVLAGMAVPNGMPTTTWFEWGSSTNYGFTTLASNAGTGPRVVRVTESVTGLLPGGICHYRLVASNATAVAYGADQNATTGSKVTAWGDNDYGQSEVPLGLKGVVAVDGGIDHSVALTCAGEVVAWGSNDDRQTNIPPGLSSVVAVSAGAYHNLALRSDGSVTAWGLNSDGQTNVPPGVSNVVGVAAGGYHNVALRDDGTVVLWGSSDHLGTNLPTGLSNVVAISAGLSYSTALKADGTIASWGNPPYQIQTNIPPGLSNVTKIAAGWCHQMVFRRDGPPIGWGVGATNVPNSISNLTEISSGSGFNVGLVLDGPVVAWDNNSPPDPEAIVPSEMSPAAAIGAGLNNGFALANRRPQAGRTIVSGTANHDLTVTLSASDVNGEALAIRTISLPTEGTLFQYTINGRGAPITSPQTLVTDPAGRVIFAPFTNQFGSPYTSFNFVANDGDLDSSPGTVTINVLGELRAATQQAWVTSPSDAILNGMVLPNGFETMAWFEWGTNVDYGQASTPINVGNGGSMIRLTNALSDLLPNSRYLFRIAASNLNGVVRSYHQLFTTGQKVAGWGTSYYGEAIGMPQLDDATAVAAGWMFSVALRANGNVVAWGDGSFNKTNIPPSFSNVVAIAANSDQILALKIDGTVAGRGISFSDLNAFTNIVAIAAGSEHYLGLRADGSLVITGRYPYNPRATIPAGLSNVVAIAALGRHSAAVRADGTIAVWGESPVPMPPADLINIVSVAGGSSHMVALKSDGTCIAFGDNSYGQTNIPTGLSNVVSIANSYSIDIAVKADGTIVIWGLTNSYSPPAGLAEVTEVAVSGHVLALAANVTPAAHSKTVSGPLNQDLVLTLSANDVNGDPLAYRIISLPANGQLYQCVSGARGSPILAGGTVTDLSARVVFVPATNQFGQPYASFNFVVNDGTMDSPVGTVTINITSPTFAVTRAVTRSTATSAMLNGVANAGHLPTTVWFEWGSSRAYGQVTEAQQLAAGNQLAWLSASITGLAAQSVYHCRLVASNAGGIAFGANRVFTTGRQAVVWDDPYPQPVSRGPSNAVAICFGYDHILTLRNDGIVEASGGNTYNQSRVPTNLAGVVQVDAGAWHSLALKSDGTVVAWGDSSDNITNVPAGLADVKEIACGNWHNVALKSNGTVVAWGQNVYGQTNVPSTLTDVVAVAAGLFNTVALRSNGTVVAWGGAGSYGSSTNIPAGLSNVVEIEYFAAVKADASVVVWGGGVTLPTNWTDIVEVDGGLALKANGTLVGGGTSGGVPISARFTNVAFFAGTHSSAAIGNSGPTAFSQKVTHAANHELVIQLNATDPQADPISLRITALPTKGNLHQFAGGGRGTQIVAPDTPVEDAGRRVVFVPAPDEYGSPYTTFGFISSDGELDSTQAVVSVTIIGSPYTATQPAAPVSSTNAVLNGMVVPNGFTTRAWFEWGTNAAFGQATPPADVGNGASVVRVSAPVDELVPGRIFYFRLVASNAVGVVCGAPRIFTTGSRLTAWGQSDYGKTNVPMNLKGVSAISADSDTTYALLTSGAVNAWGRKQTNLPAGLGDVAAISGTLALKRDGSVQDWGYGTPPVPGGLSNVVAVCGESLHRLALGSDGTVLAWGQNDYGQANVPAELKDVVAIASANNHSLALKADGSVIAWGDNYNRETNVPAGLSNVVAIACGSRRSLAVTSDGRVVAWGVNGNGQNNIPAGVSNVIALAAGYVQNLAIQVDGSLLAWGYNADGIASKPSWITNAAAVAANLSHDVVLRPNRPPSANSRSQAGTANHDQIISLSGTDPDGDALTFRITSLPVAGDLYQYDGGGRGALITSNNTIVTGSMLIFAPGTNAYGAPYVSFDFVATDGEADSAPASVTISISGTAYAATLTPGPVTTSSATLKGMALSSGLPSLAWFEWGTNVSYGFVTAPKLFDGGGSVVPLSVTLTGLTPRVEYHYRLVASNATRVAFGADQSFLTGGKITTWGRGTYGLTNVPAGLSNVVAVAGGSTHSLALRADGTVKAWGGGDYYSGTNFLNVPVDLTNAMAIGAGNNYSVALRSNSTVAVWGGSTITNVPANASNVTALASGSSHLLALRTDGRLVAWGNNSYGQLNLASGLSNVVAITGGSSHSLALRIDGTVVAWGYNSSGQCNVPGGLTNVVAVAAGSSHSLALRASGTVAGWGSQAVPAGLTNVVKIAAGDYHSLALMADGSVRVWGSNNYGQSMVPTNLGRVVEIEGGANHSLVMGDNLPPATQSRLVPGWVNADLILSLTGSDPNGDPLAFRVTTAPVPGTLYQFNAGSRGAQIAAPAAIMDVSNRVIFVPVTGESGSPYSSFDVIVNDGEVDSAPATVTVNLIVPPAPQLSAAKSGVVKLSPPFLNAATADDVGGGFGLRFLGYSNLTYQVWASTNLADWVLLGPANVTSNGWFQFVDADATNWSRRFYRISMPTDRAYGLNFSGQSNASYRVWASTNLTNWELLGIANVTSNGWFQFLDFDSARWPQRFYRAGAP